MCALLAGPTIAMSPPDDNGGGAAPPTDTAPVAKHRGGGSWSIMRGDVEVVDKLTRAEAEAFTAMAPDAQNQFIADKASERAQAGEAPAPEEPEREPTAAETDDTADTFDVTNTGVGPRFLTAGGQVVTLVPGETRPLTLTAGEKNGASGDFKFDPPGKGGRQVDSGADGDDA
jgi:hypothetical protein